MWTGKRAGEPGDRAHNPGKRHVHPWLHGLSGGTEGSLPLAGSGELSGVMCLYVCVSWGGSSG